MRLTLTFQRVGLARVFPLVKKRQSSFRRNVLAHRLRRVFSALGAESVIQPAMTTSPYGSWKSPISSKLVTESGVGLLEVRVDSNTALTDAVYWTELRYEEQGRYVVCSYNKATNCYHEWTPKGFSARTTVHEYGGGNFFVYDGAIYFSNFSDQVLYVQRMPESPPEPVVDESKKWRYADGVISPKTGLIYCVRENHEVVASGTKEPENDLVAINPTTKNLTVLVHGADFYSHPRVSPDGKKICWFQWNHPNMPWDNTEVYVAELDCLGSKVKESTIEKITGGVEESAIEPGWTANNELLYVSDRSNWWNLYHVTANGDHVNVHPVNSEIAGPQWQFGNTAYVPDPSGFSKVLTSQECLGPEQGTLGLVDLNDPQRFVMFDTGFRYNKCLALTTTGDAFFIGSGYARFPCVACFNIHSKHLQIIKESVKIEINEGYLSKVPQFIEWKTVGDVNCHGIFYPPANKDFKAPEGTKPPLLVRAHGGPTGSYSANLDLKLQYFTSRGFAVLLVNYRGSTGYGRQYRNLLCNSWGVCDVEDCCTGVDHLVREGLVDPEKVCIDGGSAGGYTTLACLVFKDTFKAGASHYGIGDLEALVRDTHKFESRYMDNLLLPMSDPNWKDFMKERSPIHHTENLNCPVALFQGDQDKIVLPNQAEMMHKVLVDKKLPTMLVMFEGEQHGFRKAENIQASLDGEFYFFGKVLGFTPADEIKEFKIDNLN